MPRGAMDRILPCVPAILAPAAVALARATGGPFVLPIAATLVAWPVLAILVARGRRAAAAGAVLAWAATLSATLIVMTAPAPAGMDPMVLNGPAYRDEMFGFIRTGAGREADPGQFVPQHLLHVTAFALLAVLSGGLLGIAMGAALVGYMSFYVGSLAAACPGSLLPYVAGWPPWAILRVAGFVLIGVVLAEPAIAALHRRAGGPSTAKSRWWVDPRGPRFARRALGLAFGLLLADIAMKTWLAPHWARLLRECLSAP